MTARALPGGVVSKESYEFMVLQILELTKQTLPLDGLFLDIHGAMNVEGMDDPEGDFIERLRAVIGNKTLISEMIIRLYTIGGHIRRQGRSRYCSVSTDNKEVIHG